MAHRPLAINVKSAGLTLLTVGTVLSSPSIARQSPLRFQTISTEHGLPTYTVMALEQDSFGFVWIGTQLGLARYDGHRLRTFAADLSSPDSLRDSFVETIQESTDQPGALWVGTKFGGLHFFDPQTWSFTAIPGPGSMDALHVGSLLQLDQSLLVGTIGAGLLRVESSGTMVPVRDPARAGGSEVSGLYTLPGLGGRIVCVTELGLQVFDPDDETFHTLRSETPLPRDVRDLAWDARTQTAWLATSEGLYQLQFDWVPAGRARAVLLDHFSQENGRIPTGDLNRVLIDKRRTLPVIVATADNGVLRLDPESGTYVSDTHVPGEGETLANNTVQSIMIDADGHLWAGTWSRGVSHEILPHRFRFLGSDPLNANSPPAASIFYLHESGLRPGEVWIGAFHGGLTRWTRPTGQFTRYFQAPSHPLNSVSVVMEDRLRDFWAVGKTDAAYRLRSEQLYPVHAGRLRSPDSTDVWVHVLHEPSFAPNQIWFGTMGGVLVYDRGTRAVVDHYREEAPARRELPSDEIWAIRETSAGQTWVVSATGLTLIDQSGDVKQTFSPDPSHADSIHGTQLTSLQVDDRGFLWIGSTASGLNRFDPVSKTALHFGPEDGLPSEEVGGIFADASGFLWLTSGRGLARLDPETFEITRFSKDDGLVNETFHYRAGLLLNSNEMVLGGTEGSLTVFRPNEIEIDRKTAQATVTGLYVDGVHRPDLVGGTDVIDLRHPNNDLTFDFAALDYRMPSKIRFRVRLDGADTDWSAPVEASSIRYPNLAPGRYGFSVIASNTDGIWGPPSEAVLVRIHPPLWETWWFSLAVGGLILGLTMLGYQYRIRQIRRVEAERRRIADDLHDDIGGKLSSIALRLDLERRSPAFDPNRLSNLAALTREVVSDLRSTVWIVGEADDDVVGLVSRMHQTADEMLVGRSHVFRQPKDLPHRRLSLQTKRNLFLFYRESLHNVVRHSQAENILVVVDYRKRTLCLEVSDDGVGFDPSTVSRGRGHNSMRRRALELGAEFHLKSEPGKGTVVRLKLPLA